jgi:hypothetical protein
MSFSDFHLAQFPPGMTAVGEVKAETDPEVADNSPICGNFFMPIQILSNVYGKQSILAVLVNTFTSRKRA